MISDEFIKYFGEENWKKEEMLLFMQNIIFDICREWLNVEPIPELQEIIDIYIKSGKLMEE